MRHTREQLSAAALTASGWADHARAAGRAADADTLVRLADAARCAAEAFATQNGIVTEDDADAAAVRALRFNGCVPAARRISGAECCPWSRDIGCCPGCGFKDVQWIFAGRQYQCLTAWSVEFHKDDGTVYRDDGTSKVQN